MKLSFLNGCTICLVVLVAFATGDEAQSASAREMDAADSPAQVQMETKAENSEGDEIKPSVLEKRSISNIARLLLGGNVPPNHPLVKYPEPKTFALASNIVAAIPGKEYGAPSGGWNSFSTFSQIKALLGTKTKVLPHIAQVTNGLGGIAEVKGELLKQIHSLTSAAIAQAATEAAAKAVAASAAAQAVTNTVAQAVHQTPHAVSDALRNAGFNNNNNNQWGSWSSNQNSYSPAPASGSSNVLTPFSNHQNLYGAQTTNTNNNNNNFNSNSNSNSNNQGNQYNPLNYNNNPYPSNANSNGNGFNNNNNYNSYNNNNNNFNNNYNNNGGGLHSSYSQQAPLIASPNQGDNGQSSMSKSFGTSGVTMNSPSSSFFHSAASAGFSGSSGLSSGFNSASNSFNSASYSNNAPGHSGSFPSSSQFGNSNFPASSSHGGYGGYGNSQQGNGGFSGSVGGGGSSSGYAGGQGSQSAGSSVSPQIAQGYPGSSSGNFNSAPGSFAGQQSSSSGQFYGNGAQQNYNSAGSPYGSSSQNSYQAVSHVSPQSYNPQAASTGSTGHGSSQFNAYGQQSQSSNSFSGNGGSYLGNINNYNPNNNNNFNNNYNNNFHQQHQQQQNHHHQNNYNNAPSPNHNFNNNNNNNQFGGGHSRYENKGQQFPSFQDTRKGGDPGRYYTRSDDEEIMKKVWNVNLNNNKGSGILQSSYPSSSPVSQDGSGNGNSERAVDNDNRMANSDVSGARWSDYPARPGQREEDNLHDHVANSKSKHGSSRKSHHSQKSRSQPTSPSKIYSTLPEYVFINMAADDENDTTGHGPFAPSSDPDRLYRSPKDEEYFSDEELKLAAVRGVTSGRNSEGLTSSASDARVIVPSIPVFHTSFV